MGSVFVTSYGEIFDAAKGGRSGITYSDCDWNVRKRAVFLPVSLPDGSRIFIASGLDVLFPAQKQRILHHRLQRMQQKLSVSHRTARTGFAGYQWGLLYVPEMY